LPVLKEGVLRRIWSKYLLTAKASLEKFSEYVICPKPADERSKHPSLLPDRAFCKSLSSGRKNGCKILSYA